MPSCEVSPTGNHNGETHCCPRFLSPSLPPLHGPLQSKYRCHCQPMACPHLRLSFFVAAIAWLLWPPLHPGRPSSHSSATNSRLERMCTHSSCRSALVSDDLLPIVDEGSDQRDARRSDLIEGVNRGKEPESLTQDKLKGWRPLAYSSLIQR